MKPLHASLLTAIVILTAGGMVLRYQFREINTLRDAGTGVRRMASRPVGDSNPASPARHESAGRESTLEPGTLAAADERAAVFLKGLHERVRPLIEKAEREAAANRARHEAARAGLLLGLNPPQVEALRLFLEGKSNAAPKTAVREWLAQHGDESLRAKYEAAEAASRTASVEHDAHEAIYRLSRVVDLTPEQKDRLYDGFIRQAAAAPEPEPAPLEFRTAITIQDVPAIADPAALARPLLTPEQLALFDAAREHETAAAGKATSEAMTTLLPALLGALQQAAAESDQD